MARTDPQKGTTIEGMMEAIRQIGLEAEAVKTDIRRLPKDPRAAILLLNIGEATHYVILDRIQDGNVRLLDADKFRNLSINDLKSIWDGYAILIGNQKHHRSDHIWRWFGRGLQTSGLLILLAVTAYSVKSAYSYFPKRQ